MRESDRWPGRDGDDVRRHGIAQLTSREPRMKHADGGNVRERIGGNNPPEPIDTDWEVIPSDDGGVVVRMGGPELLEDDGDDEAEGTYNEDFYQNLALDMDEGDLHEVAEELMEGIESDIQSRVVWMSDYERGIELLGTRLKQPRADATGEGVSQVDHPLLLQSCILYQSNASAEELPAAGPVKIDNGGKSTAITDLDAKQLEKDFNIYLTVHRPEYYPDTQRAIFQRGFGGMMFKKIFHCPIRRAPVSDSIAPGDFIVDNTATSLENCGRKTHRISMRQSVMKRMQFVGAYRDIELQTPVDDVTGIERKTKQVSGIKVTVDHDRDRKYTVYECHCELDLVGDRHMVKGKPSGLPRPYIVAIEKDSREILEIRRNWVEEDELFTERRRFVASGFVPMFGFYATGLLGILGNSNSALTAGWRIMCDKGMFSNFPGGMYLKNGDRQMDNNFRAAPGEFVPVDGGGADDIRKVVAPYPYTEPGLASMQFFQGIETKGEQVGGSASIPVAEGKADTPVGTMLAALEQTSKMISAVHMRSHTAQSLEFQTMLELIREKPEDFVKYFHRDGFWTVERLLSALDNWSLIPRADPNTPTHMHRLLKMMALKQLQQLQPEMYDARKVDEIILRSLGFDDPQEFFVPPAAPGEAPADPSTGIAQIVAQTEGMKVQSKERIEQGKGQLKMIELTAKQRSEQAKLEAAERLETMRIEAAQALMQEREQSATERELLKIAAQAETTEASQMHEAEMGGMQHQQGMQASEADREHQTREGAESRKQAVQLARMKPKPTGGKK